MIVVSLFLNQKEGKI